MTWRRAPLYVQGHELARWLATHCASTSGTPRAIADESARLARDVLTDLSLALTFPSERKARQRAADAGLVALRIRIRLLVDLGGATRAQARHVVERIDGMGRMLGAWQMHTERRRRPPTLSEEEPTANAQMSRAN